MKVVGLCLLGKCNEAVGVAAFQNDLARLVIIYLGADEEASLQLFSSQGK